MKLVNIGFGSLISEDRIVAILSPESAPIKRIVQDERERGRLIDASYGRKTKSVIVTDCGQLFLSALAPEAISAKSADKMQTGDEGFEVSSKG